MPGPMPQKSDAQLRKERLGFYREEMSEINSTLRGFLQRAKANAAFLVDKDGHLITREGVDEAMDIDAICGLVAGAFAATKHMALILGEEGFLNLFHQGMILFSSCCFRPKMRRSEARRSCRRLSIF